MCCAQDVKCAVMDSLTTMQQQGHLRVDLICMSVQLHPLGRACMHSGLHPSQACTSVLDITPNLASCFPQKPTLYGCFPGASTPAHSTPFINIHIHLRLKHAPFTIPYNAQALQLKKELEEAVRGLVLCTDLHMLFLLVPPDHALPVDWKVMEHWYSQKQGNKASPEHWVLQRVVPEPLRGAVDRFLYVMKSQYSEAFDAQRLQDKRPGFWKQKHTPELFRVFARLHTARALDLLVQEQGAAGVVQQLNLAKGMSAVQAVHRLEELKERASQHAGRVAVFCERLGDVVGVLEPIVAKYQVCWVSEHRLFLRLCAFMYTRQGGDTETL